MGVFTKPIIFVGKEFRNEPQAREYFQSKVELTEEDLDEMGPKLHFLLEARQKQGYPDGGLYSVFSGDENMGYYIGYNVYDRNPAKMQENIAKAAQAWQAMFNEEAKIVQAVLYT